MELKTERSTTPLVLAAVHVCGERRSMPPARSGKHPIVSVFSESVVNHAQAELLGYRRQTLSIA